MVNTNLKVIKRIADVVANHFQINTMEMFPNSRVRESGEKRQIFHYMASKYTKASLQEIGDFSKIMGRKTSHNHASILHSKKQVQNLMDIDSRYKALIDKLENRIYKAVSLINHSFTARDKQVQAIIDRVFTEEDTEFLELIHLLVDKIYENKNKEELSHLIFLQHKMNNERIYKTTQNDIGLGVV